VKENESRYFQDESTLYELIDALPSGWSVDTSGMENKDLIFSFPFPLGVHEDDHSKRAALSIYYDSGEDGLFMGIDPVKEEGRVVARRFTVEANWPLPNNFLPSLKRASEIIVESCVDQIMQRFDEEYPSIK